MSGAFRPLYVAEPPAQYIARPPVVLDCSVLAAFIFREASLAQALAKIDGRSLKAPQLLHTEIASVALKKQRSEFAEPIEPCLDALDTMNIELFGVRPKDTFALAQRYKLSAYDAAYLWLAAELKCPLATFDEKLGKAAKEHLASLT